MKKVKITTTDINERPIKRPFLAQIFTRDTKVSKIRDIYCLNSGLSESGRRGTSNGKFGEVQEIYPI